MTNNRRMNTKGGKKTNVAQSKEEPLVQSVVIADALDDVDFTNSRQDASVRNESLGSGHVLFAPFIDIQHTYRCGVLTVVAGFTVSGAGELIIDDATNGTGRLIV
jgi:hypothetical protein